MSQCKQCGKTAEIKIRGSEVSFKNGNTYNGNILNTYYLCKSHYNKVLKEMEKVDKKENVEEVKSENEIDFWTKKELKGEK